MEEDTERRFMSLSASRLTFAPSIGSKKVSVRHLANLTQTNMEGQVCFSVLIDSSMHVYRLIWNCCHGKIAVLIDKTHVHVAYKSNNVHYVVLVYSM